MTAYIAHRLAMHNLLTDIPGIRVGNAHDETVVTGVTAVVFDTTTVASGVTHGGAPGSRDTALLEPEMTIPGVDAVVLSGGSLFGLDAAGGVVAWLRCQGRGGRIGGFNIPIVSQAIVFDLLNGGDKTWERQPPYWDLGWRAAECAAAGPFALGSSGGGFGATTANLRGGLGSASAATPSGYTVGALAVVNAVGTATIGEGPYFWAAPWEVGCEFGGRGLPERIPAEALTLRMKGAAPPSTTIAVVVTDAKLTKIEAKRVAIMADGGLSRALRPAHAPMDGDTVVAVSTLAKSFDGGAAGLTEIGLAAADCLARAIARGVYEAAPGGPRWTGPPSWQEKFDAGKSQASGSGGDKTEAPARDFADIRHPFNVPQGYRGP